MNTLFYLIYGAISIFFGILLIIFPDIVAYIIAFFFIMSGINVILFGLLAKKKKEEGVIMGDYKVVKED